jgi:uncharacterized protein YndB with AHSA1/START domain
MTRTNETSATPGTKTAEIVVEDVLPHGPAAIWRALTTADLIGRWLMTTDFEPVVGKRFVFRAKPMGTWDGVVEGEVLEVETDKRLAYRWRGGGLDTVVTWTLSAVVDDPRSTRLRMVHSGFHLPKDQVAYNAMSPGWGTVVKRIGALIEEGLSDKSA